MTPEDVDLEQGGLACSQTRVVRQQRAAVQLARGAAPVNASVAKNKSRVGINECDWRKSW